MAGWWVRIQRVESTPTTTQLVDETGQVTTLKTGAAPHARSAEEYRALVLLPKGSALPLALLEAMQRRGMQPRVVEDLPRVMVALAKEPVTVLVVVNAVRWTKLHELGRVMQRYYPEVRCWRYDGGETTQSDRSDERGGRLKAWSWEELMHQPTIHVTVSKPRPDGLSDDDAIESTVNVGTQSSVPQKRELAEPILTREELDMLLDSSWERRRSGRRMRRRGDTDDGL